VQNMRMELLGETSIAETISYLDNGYVYIGKSRIIALLAIEFFHRLLFPCTRLFLLPFRSLFLNFSSAVSVASFFSLLMNLLSLLPFSLFLPFSRFFYSFLYFLSLLLSSPLLSPFLFIRFSSASSSVHNSFSSLSFLSYIFSLFSLFPSLLLFLHS
jgi:hypothetical protein